MDPGVVYLQYLEVINRVAESLCRRNGVFGAEAEDFASEVRLRLLEDDYAVIRKHRGDSSVPTFLTVVIGNLFRDHRIKQWGKWRPSAEAKRLGAAAVLLETAIHRDGCTFNEACILLEQKGSLKVDRSELRKILVRLPPRAARRIEDEQGLSEVAAAEQTNGAVDEAERRALHDAAEQALKRAVVDLDAEDQVIIRMHFYEGFSVADVARALHLPQKPLYARIKSLLETLLASLVRAGIGREHLEFLNFASE